MLDGLRIQMRAGVSASVLATLILPAAAQDLAPPPVDQAPPNAETDNLAPPALSGSILDLPEVSEEEIKMIPVSATLRALDKTTARFSDLNMQIDEPNVFGTLEIVVRTCDKRPPEETPETSAFIQVSDYGLDGMEALQKGEQAEKTQVFSGWMFASSPALNPLEHPVYDVWVIDCKMVAP